MYACPKRKSLRYQCCGVRFGTGIGIPQTGNRAYRKRACACPRDLSALELERQVSLVRGCRVGSLVSIIIIVRSGRFQLLFSPLSFFSSSLSLSLSLSSPPLFPRTFFPWHAFTHARHLCTQHAPLPYAVCICTRLFRRYEFECEQRGPVEGGGGSSFRASNLPFVDRDWIFSGDVPSFGKWILLFMQFSDRFNFFFFFLCN